MGRDRADDCLGQGRVVTFLTCSVEKFLDTAFTKERIKFVEKIWSLRGKCSVFIWKGECHANL
jgi:hypothetical protein